MLRSDDCIWFSRIIFSLPKLPVPFESVNIPSVSLRREVFCCSRLLPRFSRLFWYCKPWKFFAAFLPMALAYRVAAFTNVIDWSELNECDRDELLSPSLAPVGLIYRLIADAVFLKLSKTAKLSAGLIVLGSLLKLN